jgi:hypothetical protein
LLYLPFARFPDLGSLVFLFLPFSLVFLLLVDLRVWVKCGILVSLPPIQCLTRKLLPRLLLLPPPIIANYLPANQHLQIR